MPQPSSESRAALHVWRAGYRAYVDGKKFTDAPPVPEREVWLAGYIRARTDRARAQDEPESDLPKRDI
jgi:ribosome modulation factor